MFILRLEAEKHLGTSHNTVCRTFCMDFVMSDLFLRSIALSALMSFSAHFVFDHVLPATTPIS